ncbi:MAG TPA: HD-GYP domain-containing protein [Candidatus Margulisiibacteriota bacterium]|nr:HD-GYP domain-containing protein [Candidatus Margulisiibacteriota bacterium]
MTLRVRLLVLSAIAAAVLCMAAVSWHIPASDAEIHWNALAAFALLGFLSEATYLRLRVGQSETNASVAFIPFIASLMLFDTGWAVSIAAVAELGVEYVVRKKPPIKIAFNVAQLIVSLTLASWVYQTYGTTSLTTFHMTVRSALATAAAVVTYFVVNTTAITSAVALSDRLPFDAAWRRIGGPSLVYDIFSSALGPLLAFLYVQFQLWGIVMLVLPLFFVRHIYQVNMQLEQVNRDLLELMVKAIEARDQYTSGHSLRVSRVAGQLAKECGLGSKVVEQITTAALLHDVGKIHEDFAPLLRKEAKLDGTEKALMQTHPSRSADLVSTISAFRGPIEQAVRYHHENYDGTGYPHGLAAEAIPIGARVIMLADTMDAMTTDRPYRRALTYERVVEELRRYAGRQFDPRLVEVAISSAAIKDMVAARLRKEPLEAPAGGLEVFARNERPRPGRLAAAG